MNDKFTILAFQKRFETDEACLEEIKLMRYGKEYQCRYCYKATKLYKVKDRTAYACSHCGHHYYPLAGTIFDKSTTPLRLWFYAIYLMSATRAGISAKQLERELGVTYKTAWRMFNRIRKLMTDEPTLLSGEIEVDETYVGGKGVNRAYDHRDFDNKKQVVFGMVERGGKAKVRHVKSSGARVLLPEISENVKPNSMIYSDQYGSYKSLPQLGFKHLSVNHLEKFVTGDTHTQNIENLWSHIKRGITGVYRHVDAKYLQDYINEYAFRYSHRNQEAQMFDLILKQVFEV